MLGDAETTRALTVPRVDFFFQNKFIRRGRTIDRFWEGLRMEARGVICGMKTELHTKRKVAISPRCCNSPILLF